MGRRVGGQWRLAPVRRVMMKTLLAVACVVALAGLAPALAVQGDAAQGPPSPIPKAFFRDVPGPSEADLQDAGLRIWNGGVATVGQFPYYVGMYMDMSYFCGGSLIHPKWVLTAGHCVDGMSLWTMFMGVTSMEQPKQEGREVHISRGGLRHEQYDSSRIVNDIGLVQLMHAVDVTASSQIGVVKLTLAGASYIGQTPTVAGFGRIDDDLATISDVLRFAQLPIVSNDLCYSVYGDTDKSQICLETDQVKASSCSGDSGGPLVIYDAAKVPTQIGATSFGATAGCAKGYPVGFTNLAMFIDWIAEHTGIPASEFVAAP